MLPFLSGGNGLFSTAFERMALSYWVHIDQPQALGGLFFF